MSDSSHADAVLAVEASTRQISAAFETGLARIGEIRAGTAHLTQTVDSLLEVTGTGGDGHESAISHFLEVARASAAEAETVAASLADRGIDANLRDVGASLRQMSKCATELMATSMLAKIAGATADDGLDNAVFVASLDNRSRELRQTATTALSKVGSIGQQIRMAHAVVAEMTRSLQELLDGFDGDHARLATLEAAHGAHVATTRDNNARLVADVAAGVGRLIGCLQFPDTFAQRIAHVCTMLGALDEDRPAAETRAIRQLAAAHLRAIAEALDEVCATATRALATIQSTLDAATGGQWARSPSTAWISALENGSEVISRAAADARAQLDSALSILGTTSRNIVVAGDALNASQALNAQLTNAAHNAVIAASRSDSSRSALRVLAGSVKTIVENISGYARDLTNCLEAMSDLSLKLEGSDLSRRVAELDRVRDRAERDAARAAAVFEAFETLCASISARAEAICAATEIAVNAFAAARSQSADLRAAALRIEAETSPESAADGAADTRWIHALYTMEEERAVHRTLYPGDEDTASEDSAAVELDDFMF